MKVKATQPGHYKQYRNVGEVFEVPAKYKGTWFEPVREDAKGKDATPETGTVVSDVDELLS